MKRFGTYAIAAIFLLASTVALAQVRALVDANVVDLDGKNPVRDAVVLIDGDRISVVGPADSTPVPEDAEIVSVNDRWLMPGLMNMHVHLGLNLPGAAHIYNETRDSIAIRMLENAHKSLLAGTTTVRLTGEYDHVDFLVKKAIDAGTFPGPRIHTAGEIVAVTGGHGYRQADGPEGLSTAVREQLKAGATWIKLAVSGGIADTHGEIAAAPMTDAEISTAIEVAHRGGAKVTAHNGSPAAAEQAMRFGIDGFEHGYHFTDEVLEKMKAKGVWLVPTIVVAQEGAFEFFRKIGSPDWYLERVRATGKDHWRMLQDAIDIGVNIAMGSDQLPFEPNSGTVASVRETELYVDAGMTPAQALRAATSEAARMLGVEDDVGQVKPGYFADIVAVDRDPTRDISALRTISFVMKGGRVYRDDAQPCAVDRP